MPSFLQRLFPGSAIKILHSAYRDELRKITAEDRSLFGPAAGIELLNDQIVDSIYSAKTTVEKKIADGKSPRVLVLLLISNLAYQHVASGQYHTYRGLLSMRGTNLHSCGITR